MTALEYNFSIPNYLKVRAADRLPLRMLESGNIPGLDLVDMPPLELPDADWVRLKPLMTGVCGSDISMLTNRSGPALMPYVSFPLVPGHEIVAEIVEVGTETGALEVGQRVVVCPVISCGMRGLVPCQSCSNGDPGLCTQSAEGTLSPGMLTGFCHDLPGGWSREMIAHRSQVVRVSESLSLATAAVVEPFSVAVHSVLHNPPAQNDQVLIIGGGSIGLLVLAALRMLGHECPITVIARHEFQADVARKFGATQVLTQETPGEAATQITGARRYQPLRGRPVYSGGFDQVFDCVGSTSSVDDSLRVAGPRAKVVMVGCAAEMGKLDLSFVWSRELTITGSYVYGRERSLEGSPHTFDVSLRLIDRNPDIDIGNIVTHVFPLQQWQHAFQVSFERKQFESIKIAFDST